MDIVQWLHRLLSFYLLITVTTLRFVLLALTQIKRFPFIVTLADAILSVYARFCGLSPCTVDLDDQTTMHYWAPTHRRFNKPALVLIHGCGSTSLWQFMGQVGPLSRSFDLFVPDLLFFGKSYTRRSDRTEMFQARCVCEGLRRLGVGRFTVYGMSYGGWVGYWMAEMYPEMVEKLVIVSSGVGFREDHKEEHLRKIGRKVTDLVCPEEPKDLRMLVNLALHKYDLGRWVPDFLLREFITVMFKNYKKERRELIEYLLAKKTESDLPIVNQETLLIWGEKDRVFPLLAGHQLQRQLGPKSKLEIIKDTGHAANIECPNVLNDLIKSFVLG